MTELSEEDQREAAFLRVTEHVRLHGIVCTGSPIRTECPEPPCYVVVLHGVAFTCSCLECVNQVIGEILAMGHGSCRQDAILGFENAGGPAALADFSVKRRASSLAAGGVKVIKGKYYSAKREREWRNRE